MTDIERLKRERDAYKRAAVAAGVCPTCIIQAPEPYGCSDCLNTGWVLGEQFVWISQHLSYPRREGWYRVVHSGDSESVDGYTIYDYPDYEAWAYWTPAREDEFEDFEGGYKGSWMCSHDEDGDFIVAFCGPIPVPSPFKGVAVNG